jgi:hypothetical protein
MNVTENTASRLWRWGASATSYSFPNADTGAKKEFGKPVEQLPLPEAKNLPVVRRFTFS